MKRRKIPTLQYSVKRESDYNLITENPVTKKYVYEMLLDAVKHALEKNKPEIELLKIHNTNMCLCIHQKDWKSMLNKAIDFFISQENYEKCQEYQKIIDSL